MGKEIGKAQKGVIRRAKFFIALGKIYFIEIVSVVFYTQF